MRTYAKISFINLPPIHIQHDLQSGKFAGSSSSSEESNMRTLGIALVGLCCWFQCNVISLSLSNNMPIISSIDRQETLRDDDYDYGNGFVYGFGSPYDDDDAMMCPATDTDEDADFHDDSLVDEFSNSQEDQDVSPVTTLNVEDFGARGDGKSDDTKAFELAWKDACARPGSYVNVTKGKSFVLSPITFSGPCRGPVTMQVKGKIVAPSDPRAWVGKDTRLWLLFRNVTDLTLQGGGTIDGQGSAWWRNSCKVNKSNPCSHAPTAVTFESVNNLRVRKLQVLKAQQFHISFQDCFAVKATDITVKSPRNSPNTDGIHVTGSKSVLIRRASIATGDDCISIVGGSLNVKAKDISCGPGHGISIGSLGKGNSEDHVANIMVDRASLSQTTNGVRIKTWQGGSGYARSITFKNIKMKNVSNPIIIDQYYCDSNKPCPEQKSAVKISSVVYKNIKGTSATNEAIKLDCSRTVSCDAIQLQNIQLKLESGGSTAVSHCINAHVSVKGKVIPPPCSSNTTLS